MGQPAAVSWQEMKLMIAGGGTGGHVFPALAIAEEWRRRSRGEVVLVGTAKGIENRLVPQAGFPLERIPAAALKGIGGVRLAKSILRLPLVLLAAGRVMRRNNPDVVLGIGGYASGPVVLSAALCGIPTAIFEPNAEPGFANRVVLPFVKRAAVAYPETAARLGERGVLTGCPVRAAFFGLTPRRHEPPFSVLIFGGSQGSLALNQTMIEALDFFSPRREELFFTHQTGERDYNAVRVAYGRRAMRAEVRAFLDDMPDRFGQADLIVSRSGAVTVAEIAAAGRASILVPFPEAADQHQLRNAQALERAKAARLLLEEELTPERLATEILTLLEAPEKLRQMEGAARELARPRATQDIVDMLERIARK